MATSSRGLPVAVAWCLGDGPPGQLDQRLEPGRGVVRQLVVVALDAHERRRGRRQLDVLLEVPLGDLVDRAVRCGGIRHLADPTPRPPARLTVSADTVAVAVQCSFRLLREGNGVEPAAVRRCRADRIRRISRQDRRSPHGPGTSRRRAPAAGRSLRSATRPVRAGAVRRAAAVRTGFGGAAAGSGVRLGTQLRAVRTGWTRRAEIQPGFQPGWQPQQPQKKSKAPAVLILCAARVAVAGLCLLARSRRTPNDTTPRLSSGRYYAVPDHVLGADGGAHRRAHRAADQHDHGRARGRRPSTSSRTTSSTRPARCVGELQGAAGPPDQQPERGRLLGRASSRASTAAGHRWSPRRATSSWHPG